MRMHLPLMEITVEPVPRIGEKGIVTHSDPRIHNWAVEDER